MRKTEFGDIRCHRFDLNIMNISRMLFRRWLKENDISDDDWFDDDYMIDVIYFCNDETAIAFKLRWI